MAAGKRTDQAPRYEQVARELRREILAGKFTASDQFPTESDLCRRYGVSRFTIREALRRLQSEGLIARKRGSGTMVCPAAARSSALHQPHASLGEILQYPRDTQISFAPAGRGPLPRALAEEIGEDGGGDWTSLFGLHLRDADPQPLAATHVYLHGSLDPVIPAFNLASGTLLSQFALLAGVSACRVTQHIQAASAPGEIAQALAIKHGAPVLRITRCYRDAEGQLVEISVSHHPGDRFTYSLHVDLDG